MIPLHCRFLRISTKHLHQLLSRRQQSVEPGSLYASSHCKHLIQDHGEAFPFYWAAPGHLTWLPSDPPPALQRPPASFLHCSAPILRELKYEASKCVSTRLFYLKQLVAQDVNHLSHATAVVCRPWTKLELLELTLS